MRSLISVDEIYPTLNNIVFKYMTDYNIDERMGYSELMFELITIIVDCCVWSSRNSHLSAHEDIMDVLSNDSLLSNICAYICYDDMTYMINQINCKLSLIHLGDNHNYVRSVTQTYVEIVSS